MHVSNVGDSGAKSQASKGKTNHKEATPDASLEKLAALLMQEPADPKEAPSSNTITSGKL